jgi:hypothetical protein
MLPVLATKDNAKGAWDTIKKMRVGIREAHRQKLHKDFENLSFKNGEGIEDFSLRISGILSELQSLGDNKTELDAVQKFLCVVPSRYGQMACSIETMLDLEDMSIKSSPVACKHPRDEVTQRWTHKDVCFLQRKSGRLVRATISQGRAHLAVAEEARNRGAAELGTAVAARTEASRSRRAETVDAITAASMAAGHANVTRQSTTAVTRRSGKRLTLRKLRTVTMMQLQGCS